MSFREFLADQLTRSEFWLLFLGTLATTMLLAWRSWLRNRIYWSIR